MILPSDRTKTSHIKKLKSQSDRKRKCDEGAGKRRQKYMGLNADFERLNSITSSSVPLRKFVD